MHLKTIEKLCCPFDKADLHLQVFVKDTEQNVLEGIFTCSSCQRKYPIFYGVPIMAPDEYRQSQLETPILEKWKIEHSSSDVNRLS